MTKTLPTNKITKPNSSKVEQSKNFVSLKKSNPKTPIKSEAPATSRPAIQSPPSKSSNTKDSAERSDVRVKSVKNKKIRKNDDNIIDDENTNRVFLVDVNTHEIVAECLLSDIYQKNKNKIRMKSKNKNSTKQITSDDIVDEKQDQIADDNKKTTVSQPEARLRIVAPGIETEDSIERKLKLQKKKSSKTNVSIDRGLPKKPSKSKHIKFDHDDSENNYDHADNHAHNHSIDSKDRSQESTDLKLTHEFKRRNKRSQ